MTEYFQLRLPSHTDYLDLIRDFVSKLSDHAGFNEENVYKIALAVDEACTNVIRHAYRRGNEQFIDVHIELDDKGLTITVSDTGVGFDPASVSEPDLEEYMARHKVGGFGLYLIKTVMDEVNFSINPGVKNEVRMTKFLKRV